ncbi:hypothetical protein SCB71_07595 [Herbiconiux sp. KACC 21604]|uniref:hypothetical protein n=1 Tax=unclassified Herbiconiux TaxID=2618217 RepID=UPI001492E9EE|nr:hypothetical protein [Herbiconiux sp. SALV-R1]QJU53146.1 hypothetical protein HL652_05565 [Herbiconiux sp. SALV-R1]WPO88089.1 hypothetical protein SCB71_07595 [Herbiconiux sp. KACC 21604]
MSDPERAIARIVQTYPNVKVVLSDSVFADSYFHSAGPDGGTLYINAELTEVIASQPGWVGSIITTEPLPED